MSIITGLLQNMAQNLTDEIGSGLYNTLKMHSGPFSK